MKKAALTFALLSTVMVVTSFATPQTNNSSKTSIGVDTDGQVLGNGKRKQDFQEARNIQVNFNQSEGFRQDRQSVGVTKKMD